MDGDRLSAHLAAERARVDAALAEVVERALGRSRGPLVQPMRYALATSGKRLRPILCVAAYRAVRGDVTVTPPLYRLACALEIVHTYSLVHDDLPCMDDDDLRRGRATVHRVFGAPHATLAGASLLSLAVQVLLDEGEAVGLSVDERAALVRELCAATGATGMVGGQFLDLEGEGSAVGADRLETIHRAKTGALLTVSLRLGGLAARASAAEMEALTRYGDALGLAFQIADDVLDVVGETAALGKTAGRDQALSKSSYPALFGLEEARRMARALADDARDAIASLGSQELWALAGYVVERHH
jgi:geranylgeranyl diphosphate synthase, type II